MGPILLSPSPPDPRLRCLATDRHPACHTRHVIFCPYHLCLHLAPNMAPTMPYLSGSSLVNQNLVASSIPLSLFLTHSLSLDLQVLIIYQIFSPHSTIITIASSLSYFIVKTSMYVFLPQPLLYHFSVLQGELFHLSVPVCIFVSASWPYWTVSSLPLGVMPRIFFILKKYVGDLIRLVN